eukprot:749092-Hanusia_phi.AAC.3
MVNVKKAEKNGVQLDALKREVHMLMRLNSPVPIHNSGTGGTLGDLIEDTRGTVSRIGEERIRSLSSQLAKVSAGAKGYDSKDDMYILELSHVKV